MFVVSCNFDISQQNLLHCFPIGHFEGGGNMPPHTSCKVKLDLEPAHCQLYLLVKLQLLIFHFTNFPH